MTTIPVATAVSDLKRNSSHAATRTLALRAGFIAALVLTADELLTAFVRARLPVCDIHALTPCERLDVFGPVRMVRTEYAGSALGFAHG